MFPRFHYESANGRKKFESQPPFDKYILRKFESKRYESKSGAVLAGLTVTVHAQSKRVVKL